MTEPAGDGCTWVPPGVLSPEIIACCDIHDTVGTDGMLLDCWRGTLPKDDSLMDYVGASIMALAVLLMTLGRPIYETWLKITGKYQPPPERRV